MSEPLTADEEREWRAAFEIKPDPMPLLMWDAGAIKRLFATLDAARARIAEVEAEREEVRAEMENGKGIVLRWRAAQIKLMAAERASLTHRAEAAETALAEARGALKVADEAFTIWAEQTTILRTIMPHRGDTAGRNYEAWKMFADLVVEADNLRPRVVAAFDACAARGGPANG